MKDLTATEVLELQREHGLRLQEAISRIWGPFIDEYTRKIQAVHGALVKRERRGN